MPIYNAFIPWKRIINYDKCWYTQIPAEHHQVPGFNRLYCGGAGCGKKCNKIKKKNKPIILWPMGPYVYDGFWVAFGALWAVGASTNAVCLWLGFNVCPSVYIYECVFVWRNEWSPFLLAVLVRSHTEMSICFRGSCQTDKFQFALSRKIADRLL